MTDDELDALCEMIERQNAPVPYYMKEKAGEINTFVGCELDPMNNPKTGDIVTVQGTPIGTLISHADRGYCKVKLYNNQGNLLE